MRDYDPWIFGMLWEREHQEELRRLADARLARQAAQSQPRGSSAPEGPRFWSPLRRLTSGFENCVRLWIRGLRHETEGGA
jgi:hypothetical protein